MKKFFKRLLITCISIFVLLNIFIAIHCYKLTHVVNGIPPITTEYKQNISFLSALKLAFIGIDLPRAVVPQGKLNYKTLYIPIDNNKSLAAWHIPTDSVKKGTVLLFHGYTDNKSGMLEIADEFRAFGYDAFLIDFMGTGDSYGNQTTMGVLESENVYQTYNYVKHTLHETNILIYGFSMGAVATLKAQANYQMDVKGIMLQAAYATFEGTIEMRVKRLGLPKQPTSSLFTFWMGAVNGFDGFDVKPIEDAKKVTCPTLVMCGSQDPHIPKEETEEIYQAIASHKKMLQLFENSKHESLLKQHSDLWKNTVNTFISEVEQYK